MSNETETKIMIAATLIVVVVAVAIVVLDDRERVLVIAEWCWGVDPQLLDPGTEDASGIRRGRIMWVEVNGEPRSRNWFLENQERLKQTGLYWGDPNSQ